MAVTIGSGEDGSRKSVARVKVVQEPAKAPEVKKTPEKKTIAKKK